MNRRHQQRSFFISNDYKRNLKIFVLFLIFLYLSLSFHKCQIKRAKLENTKIYSKLIEIIFNSNRTLCSEQANRHGRNQKIISFSLFGPKENSRFEDEQSKSFLLPLINEAKSLFPDWIIRLYADEITIERLKLRHLSRLSSNVDICNVNNLPYLGNVGEYLSGKLWRFLPSLDPTVDFISSRDLDSPLLEREKQVVDQFLNSSFLFLTIRDHPLHGIPILGGLWTAALTRNRLLFLDLFTILLDRENVYRYALALDQLLLTEIVWPKVEPMSLVFDSYTCEQIKGGHQQTFQSQRPSLDCHIGCVRPCCQNSTIKLISKPCPLRCRPNNHQDWTFC